MTRFLQTQGNVPKAKGGFAPAAYLACCALLLLIGAV
jgi:hypothetical protein